MQKIQKRDLKKRNPKNKSQKISFEKFLFRLGIDFSINNKIKDLQLNIFKLRNLEQVYFTSFICYGQKIIDLEVVFRELLDLTNLFGARIFCINKVIRIILINKNKHLVFAIL